MIHDQADVWIWGVIGLNWSIRKHQINFTR
jgi:hypothetical protein